MAKRNFIPLVPSGTINADASVAQLEQDVLAMDAKVGELAEDIGDTEQEINQLKSQISEVEAGFPQKSASGSIVTIDDGADNVPVVSLTADIDPVQDLHGYDNPWPAGGGKNLYPYATIPIYTYDWYSDYTFDGTPNKVLIEADTDYVLSFANTANQRVNIRVFDTSKNLITDNTVFVASQGVYPLSYYEVRHAFSIGGDISDKYVTIRSSVNAYINIVMGQDCPASTNVQLELGSTATSYAPYSNLCPISGWTAANVSVQGETINIWNERWEVGDINRTTGQDSPSEYQIRSVGYTPVKPSTQYKVVIGSDAPAGSSLAILFYNADRGFIVSYWVTDGNAPWSPSTAAYMRFTSNNTYGATYGNNISINYPSTDTAYHPYVGNVTTITFPAGAGTVYGGTLVLNQDGTADLTVTWGEVAFGSLSWIYTPWTVDYLYASVAGRSITGFNLLTSAYPVATTTQIAQMGDKKIVGSTTDDKVYLRDSSFSDAASFKSAMGDVQLVFELAEPIVYHIENVELVKTLYGLNNIWADTGDISLTYRADPATYTAEQIQTMLNAMVAPVEATTTASKAYSVNDFLILNNTLYKVVSPIANGGTITPNTNVTATTVGAQLTAILNS